MKKLKKYPYKIINQITHGFRKAFKYTKMYNDCLNASKIEWYKGKRRRVSYKCNRCSDMFGRAEIHVDHIDPVIPIGKKITDITFNVYFDRLFTDHLQVLCKLCHKAKTKEENSRR